ncbi:MAG: PEP-CTERM sorting domain-containing protein [Planctomycetia bacterium]|jgi:hypothetical protein
MAMLCGVSRPHRALFGAVLAFLIGTVCARAEIIFAPSENGSQGFVDVGNTIAALTNDVNDARVFTLRAFVSTAESHGYFAALPMQFFGPVTFNVDNHKSLAFSTLEFGSFESTKIRQLSNDPIVGSRSFVVEGWYSNGTFGGPLFPNPLLTNLTLSFNQNAGTGKSISVNATLDFASIQPVPEPSAVALATVALGTAGVVWLRRGRSGKGGSSSLPAGLHAEADAVEEERAVVADRRAGV